MHPLARRSAVLLVLGTAACTGDAAPPTVPAEPPTAPPPPVGVYQIAVTGLGTADMRSMIAPRAEGGPGAAFAPSPVGSGLAFEQVSSSSFTEGPRGAGGQRYVSFTYGSATAPRIH